MPSFNPEPRSEEPQRESNPYEGLEVYSSAWDAVEIERRQIIEEDPTQIRNFDFLNNFYACIPGGYLRSETKIGGHMLPFLADNLHAETEQEVKSATALGHSTLWMNMTPRQFFAIVDSLLPSILEEHVTTLGFPSIEELRLWSEKITALPSSPPKWKMVEQLKDPLLVPLYLELRKRGFSHQDLTV